MEADEEERTRLMAEDETQIPEELRMKAKSKDQTYLKAEKDALLSNSG